MNINLKYMIHTLLILCIWSGIILHLACDDQGSAVNRDSYTQLDSLTYPSLDQMMNHDMSILISDMEDQIVLDMTLDQELVKDPFGVMPGNVDVLTLKEVRDIDISVFATSSKCALCHSNHSSATAMRDSQGKEIAPFNLWQGSMMANAGRDPFWWAQVASEVALNDPDKQDEVEGMCIRCHAPLLSEAVRKMTSRDARMQDLISSNSPSLLGVDGVSCTGCHQIQADNLGQEESFSGGFVIGDERLIFGPHRNPATGPMRVHVDYTPTFSDHVTTSALCATCHTLLHTVTPQANETSSDTSSNTSSVFPEQTPYLEWQNSIFSTEDEANVDTAKSCQDCHQPTFDDSDVEISTRIARSPPGGDFRIDRRTPFGKHTFVGANSVIPLLIKQERATLNPQASDEAFDMISRLAVEQVTKSVSLNIKDIEQQEGKLDFTIELRTFSGHKFPTGFPARRAWLWVEVLDMNDQIIFRSGAFNEEGRIIDQNGQLLDNEKVQGAVEPHHQIIQHPQQVQIYQAVMQDHTGKPTHALTRAKGWMKDNRLLPRGYRIDHPQAHYTLPVGIEDDENFIGGGDLVQYQITLPATSPARKVVARIVYQSLGAKFLRLLFQSDVPEVAAFRTMYERAEIQPIIINEMVVDL